MKRRLPVRAIVVLAALPFWAFLYAGAFGERATETPQTTYERGRSVYVYCAGCHGVSGEGVTGPALTDVEATFPDVESHKAWVRGGSGSVGVGNPYGDPKRGRIARGGMPPFPKLSEADLEAVVLYEREAFGK